MFSNYKPNMHVYLELYILVNERAPVSYSTSLDSSAHSPMVPHLAMSSSVRQNEMRSEKSLRSFKLLISNSTKKRFKGRKKKIRPKQKQGVEFTVA